MEIQRIEKSESVETAVEFCESLGLESDYGIDCHLILSEEEVKAIESRYEDPDSDECYEEKEAIALRYYAINELKWVVAMELKFGVGFKEEDSFWQKEWEAFSFKE